MPGTGTLPAVESGPLGVERKLAAIMAADVVGSSRLMESNEEVAVAELSNFKNLIAGIVDSHHGRIFGGAGDSLVVEFASAVSAVRCALDVQREVELRNHERDAEARIQFRIGINLGDVMIEGENLMGDGVNVAARLEALAPVGGFAVSGSIYEQIRGKVEILFDDAGDYHLKNISRPVRVWRWSANSTDATVSRAQETNGKPSVAVLPFINMSGEVEQEYFSDGITEDIITDLSKISDMFVPSRNSSFLYKGKAVVPARVADELSVGHVLEGSVRKSGSRVRITAQLIDAATGGHVWADRFDRDLTDVFAVQDEITHRIVESLRVTLLPGEKEAIDRIPTDNVEAYNSYLLGRQFFRRHTRTNYELAKRMFETALEHDPNYARAWAGVADCDSFLFLEYYRGEGLDNILEASARALELDADLSEAHASRGLALSTVDRLSEAEDEFTRAIALDPDLYEAHYFYARACFSQGRTEEAAFHFERAMEIMPAGFEAPIFLMQLLFDLGNDDRALEVGKVGFDKAEQELVTHPENVRAAYLGAAYLINEGDNARAREWLTRALAIEPEDFLTLYNVACGHARLGDSDRAIDLLERALPHAHSEIRSWVEHDSDLDSLRDSPRFVSLLESLSV